MKQAMYRRQETGDRRQDSPVSRLPPPASSRGFTLIEAIVAVSMFLILLGAVMSVFTTFTRQQRSGIAQATLLGEAQNAVEMLEREVRTGFSNTFVGSGFTFRARNQNGECVTYALSGTHIRRQGVPVTSSAIEIRSLDFTAVRADEILGDPPILGGQQGRVTVRMRACPKGLNDQRCLQLQTTLTSRQYAPAPECR